MSIGEYCVVEDGAGEKNKGVNAIDKIEEIVVIKEAEWEGSSEGINWRS